MRAFLLFLLCLTIPVQGVAAAHAFNTPCSMDMPVIDLVAKDKGAQEPGDQSMAMADGAAGDDCCNDAAVVTETGHPCKTGQECPSGGLGILIRPTLTTSALVVSQAFPAALLFIRSSDPTSVWRPPALI